MKQFSRLTKTTEDASKKNVVLMGRNTWESIPEKFRPLPGRLNFVVSSKAAKNPESFPGCIPCENFDCALKEVEKQSKDIETVWVIGGSSIYKAALDLGVVDRIYLTRIFKDFDCDTFMPEMSLEKFKLVQDPLVPTDEQTEQDIKYKYEVYEKVNM